MPRGGTGTVWHGAAQSKGHATRRRAADGRPPAQPPAPAIATHAFPAGALISAGRGSRSRPGQRRTAPARTIGSSQCGSRPGDRGCIPRAQPRCRASSGSLYQCLMLGPDAIRDFGATCFSVTSSTWSASSPNRAPRTAGLVAKAIHHRTDLPAPGSVSAIPEPVSIAEPFVRRPQPSGAVSGVRVGGLGTVSSSAGSAALAWLATSLGPGAADQEKSAVQSISP
jgi:hypothetical protein